MPESIAQPIEATNPPPAGGPSPPAPASAWWFHEVWLTWRPELIQHASTTLIVLTVFTTDFASVSAAVGILVGLAKVADSLGFTGKWAEAILVFHKVVVVLALGILAWFLFRDLLNVHNRRAQA